MIKLDVNFDFGSTGLEPMELPVKYTQLTRQMKRKVREHYVRKQNGKCFYCSGDLKSEPPAHVKRLEINWDYFPDGFLDYPVHLHHDHKTEMTIGAVHSFCNGVLWQIHGE